MSPDDAAPVQFQALGQKPGADVLEVITGAHVFFPVQEPVHWIDRGADIDGAGFESLRLRGDDDAVAFMAARASASLKLEPQLSSRWRDLVGCGMLGPCHGLSGEALMILERRSRQPSVARFLALGACVFAVLVPRAADACRNMVPSMATLDGYHSIFVGHVTGLHLQGYENALLGKPDLVHPELGNLTITDGASPVSVRVAVTLSIRGSMSGPVELRLAGCTFDLPELRERGIFFVQPGGTSTVVAWEDDADYETWLGRLGVAQEDR